ncbi:MAG: hypothetical protein ACR2K5_14860 [Pseudolabrys sp.]
MRMLLGLVLGIAITIGGTYLYDSHNALAATSNGVPPPQPVVNWDVAGQKWNLFTDSARLQWGRLSERARVEWIRHIG